MKRTSRYPTFVALLLVVMVALAGCAGAGAPNRANNESVAPSAPAEPGMDFEESGAGELSPDDLDAAAQDLPRMIIYTGDLSLVVTDPDAAQQQAVALAESVGGYVAEASSSSFGDGLRRISLTLRVPASAFNDTMQALRELALEVDQDTISTQDVTQEYVDLTSRLAALEVKAARLEELMEEAEDTEAVLAVYQELSETQIQIEETKGRMRYLERRSDMSTITVRFTPDALSRPVEVAGWRPQGTARRAVEALINTFRVLLDALIWIVIVGVPLLAFIGLVVFALIKLLQLIFGRANKRGPAGVTTASPASQVPPDDTTS